MVFHKGSPCILCTTTISSRRARDLSKWFIFKLRHPLKNLWQLKLFFNTLLTGNFSAWEWLRALKISHAGMRAWIVSCTASLIWKKCVFCTMEMHWKCQTIKSKLLDCFLYAGQTSVIDRIRLTFTQGLLYHRMCKPDFLCSWLSLNSYLE